MRLAKYIQFYIKQELKVLGWGFGKSKKGASPSAPPPKWSIVLRARENNKRMRKRPANDSNETQERVRNEAVKVGNMLNVFGCAFGPPVTLDVLFIR